MDTTLHKDACPVTARGHGTLIADDSETKRYGHGADGRLPRRCPADPAIWDTQGVPPRVSSQTRRCSYSGPQYR